MHMFIWAPLAVDDLRLKLPKADRQGAVLVPLEKATVLVFTEPPRLTAAAKTAYKMRTNAVVFLWNETAAAVYPVTGPVALGWEWGTDEQVFGLVAQAGRHGKLGRAQLRLQAALSTSKDNKGKQARAARRIAECLRAPGEQVLQHVANRLPGGLPAVTGLLDVAGQPEVAQIAQLLSTGAFDAWRGQALPVVPFVNGNLTGE
jgi:hypothetical protein